MFTTSVLQCYYCFYNLSICCCCICTTSLLHAYYFVLCCHYFVTTCSLLVSTCVQLIYYMFATFYLCYYTLLLFILCYYFLLLLNIVYHVLVVWYIFYGQTPPLVLVPSSHYYLGSLSWTSRTFYCPDSRYLLEVLRDFLGRERGGP
jgi:hypothetical protein